MEHFTVACRTFHNLVTLQLQFYCALIITVLVANNAGGALFICFFFCQLSFKNALLLE